MPVGFLTEAERLRLTTFPANTDSSDLLAYFTLSPSDLKAVRRHTAERNRLGFALQLCALRYLGFIPTDLGGAAEDIVQYVSQQIDVEPAVLDSYATRAETRQRHIRDVIAHLSFRKATKKILDTAERWLLQRALDHDRPLFLLRSVCEHLYVEKVVRPGLTQLERLVARVRSQAQQQLFARTKKLLTKRRRRLLDSILLPDETRGPTPLYWLSRAETSPSARSVNNAIRRLRFLRENGVHTWDVSTLSSNRLKLLARLARRYSNQALQRMPERRRYPILIGFLVQAHQEITDEIVELYDEALAQANRRAKKKLVDFRGSVARSTNEKLQLFQDIVALILDPNISDGRLRRAIYRHMAKEKLAEALEEARRIARPSDDSYYDFVANHYSHLRKFTAEILDIFKLKANRGAADLLDAVALIQKLDAQGKRSIPVDPPLTFVPPKWLHHVVSDQGKVERRMYELCVLYELRKHLRAGNVWVEGSRRYANVETYLIPKQQWRKRRSRFCREVQVASNPAKHLAKRAKELERLLEKVDRELPENEQVRVDKKGLVISRLEAEEVSESAERLQGLIASRLPRVDLTDLLIEVDGWTSFMRHFTHAAGAQPRTPDLMKHLHASVLTQAWNFWLQEVAHTADLSYDRLRWVTRWYLRDETIKPGFTELVNFHHRLPLTQLWGGGTLSSSDGQRFPVAPKSRTARVIRKYGLKPIVTFYSWTSDQGSQYGTKPVISTDRDGRYVLDEIMDNESDLNILEHTTDTTGYTEIVFALFDLLGMQFSPRIRDMADTQLYRMDRRARYSNLHSMIKGTINQKRILKHSDEMLRIAASIKDGCVTASLLIGKLNSYPQKNAIARALQEYGHILKSIAILKCLDSEQHRRRINRQLNKGEELHQLRSFIAYGNRGVLQKAQPEEHADQAACLNLVTNAVVVWNTVYMQAVIKRLRKEGHKISDEDAKHVSPGRFGHINRLGRYNFDVGAGSRRQRLRPLRKPRN